MNTLRAKIALLLVVAIVSVVGILTWVMIALLGPPSPQRTTEPLAEQVEMFLRGAGGSEGRRRIEWRISPPSYVSCTPSASS